MIIIIVCAGTLGGTWYWGRNYGQHRYTVWRVIFGGANFVKSCRGSSESIFVVLNFVTPEARYANDVNSRVENFVGRKFRDSLG